MAEANPKPPPAHSSPPDKDEEVIERRTLRDYYIILRERLWIALPLAVLISVGYGYVKLRELPRYAAAATLQFEKPDSGQVIGTRVYDPGIQNEYDLNTYIQILVSAKLQARVRDSFSPEELAVLRRAALKRAQPGTARELRVNLAGETGLEYELRDGVGLRLRLGGERTDARIGPSFSSWHAAVETGVAF